MTRVVAFVLTPSDNPAHTVCTLVHNDEQPWKLTLESPNKLLTDFVCTHTVHNIMFSVVFEYIYIYIYM